jgi:hypothetical protein
VELFVPVGACTPLGVELSDGTVSGGDVVVELPGEVVDVEPLPELPVAGAENSHVAEAQ